jgi:hypothetical protein
VGTKLGLTDIVGLGETVGCFFDDPFPPFPRLRRSLEKDLALPELFDLADIFEGIPASAEALHIQAARLKIKQISVCFNMTLFNIEKDELV